MLSRSSTILTRGHIAKNAVSYITSGYILIVEEIPIPVVIDHGGRSRESSEKEKKKIRITLYINNEKYVKEKIVDKDVKILMENISIEWKDDKPRIILK
jgi:hypothetical protein